MTHPRPDRSDYLPNFTKSADHDTLSIAWCEGVFSDGRPYRVELWAQDQLTCLTAFFSTGGIEQLSNAAACDLLEHEGLLRYNPGSGFRSSYTRPFIDPSGNPMWSVNVVLAAEEAEFAEAPGPFLRYSQSPSSSSVSAKPRVLISIGRDTTLRWSFRSGDYLVWVRTPIWASEPSPEIVDFWELRDRNHALLTNRYEDIPDWFELHPNEVCDRAAIRMMERLNAGYHPNEATEGPNIWRVMAGDWLMWIGPARAGVDAFQDGFALALCAECVLIIGEGTPSIEDPVGFGTPRTGNFSEYALESVRAGIAEIRRQGLPRSIATEWLLG